MSDENKIPILPKGINLSELNDDELGRVLKTGSLDEEKEKELSNESKNLDTSVIEKESPSHQGEETKEEEKKDVNVLNIDDDKQIPFHKHPRFRELIEENKTLKQQNEEVDKRLKELEQIKIDSKSSPDPIPEWFKKLYGDDEDVWNTYKTARKQENEEIKNGIIQDLRQAEISKQQIYDQQSKWVRSNLDKLREEGNVFDENKLLKILVEEKPTDEQGNFNFAAGLRIYKWKYGGDKGTNEEKEIKAKKDIANTSMSHGIEATPKPNYFTAKELRTKSFSQIANE